MVTETENIVDTGHHIVKMILAAGIISLSTVLVIKTPDTVCLPGFEAYSLPGLCLFHQIFGLDCPFCGLTRSFVALGHLDLARAWEFNKAGILLYLWVAGQIPYRALALIKRKNLGGGEKRRFFRGASGLLLGAALMGGWIHKICQRILT